MWVPPFGNPRVKGYLRLTAAYRSLSRPSSATGAKASSLRSFMLDLRHSSLCNLVLSCSLCVLNLSLHEFCKTTFVPTYIFTRQNCFCNNLFSNLNSFPYCCLLNSFLLFSSQGTFLFTSLAGFPQSFPQNLSALRWAQVDSNHRPRAYQARALTA